MLDLNPVALGRVRGVLARTGLSGAVLTTPGMVAWATDGLNAPIDRSAGTDVVWVAIGTDSVAIVTTNVEGPRLAAESEPDRACPIVTAPWWDADAMVAAAVGSLGCDRADVGADGHGGFAQDLTVLLTAQRMHLTEDQRRSLGVLGFESAAAVESALRTWRPGETDRDIAARIAAAVESFGGQCPVLLVGGDQRVRRFRHPVAIGAPVKDLVMAVLVASRGGQHVALTRFAAKGPVDQGLQADLEVARSIHYDVLSACTPDATLGRVMTRLADSYARRGHPDAWRDHYQGGPIGYAQRECEIAPVQADSPWWHLTLPEGSAVAFNPSLAGGAKDEDTFVLTADGPHWITRTPHWPTTTDSPFPRPIVLDIEN